MHTALKVHVRGRVQGVGFRPFIFQLAEEYCLTGTVQNNMDGVKIHVEGSQKNVEEFISKIRNNAPRLSKIDSIEVKETDAEGYLDFSIISSERSGASMLVLPIDSAVCPECLQEMNNPEDFRFNYPFINCTQCGPRYTIISELPYDRPYTSMNTFPMCQKCQYEYENPLNRRHHAQPIACPTCGPNLWLIDAEGAEVSCENSIGEAIQRIKSGSIVAIKGIGGFHLCCDAFNEEAVRLLRSRKIRPNRPLAVMGASLEVVRNFVNMNDAEEALLSSPESPIVVLKKKSNNGLAESIASGMNTIGVMLPYSPLHHLLFKDSELLCIVMTSANPSGMPILYENNKATAYLNGIADYFLFHDRDILHPVDDSVVQIMNGRNNFFRRSRGYVPNPLLTTKDVDGMVAFGGQQKTTFTIGRHSQIFIGPHIGDVENVETIEHYKQELDHLLKWIDIPKKTAVVDVHPDYQTRSIVEGYPFDEVIEVQHHHAHMVACMEENEVNGQSFGIILDGTGFGTDGHIWGFEILYGDASEFRRLAHLTYTALPGSEKSIKEPWRNAVGMLISLLGNDGLILSEKIFPQKKSEISILSGMIQTNLNTVMAGTCGRLFDAVSAICGLGLHSTYDGEAAILLSEQARLDLSVKPYPFEIHKVNGMYEIDFSIMLRKIAHNVLDGVDIITISTRFHETLVKAICSMMSILKKENYTQQVVLSGGSFHNRYLAIRLKEELEKRDFDVFTHDKVPCNDGGLSYGQLMVAAAKRRSAKCALEFQQK